MPKEIGPKEKAMREAREAKYAAKQPVKKAKPKKGKIDKSGASS